MESKSEIVIYKSEDGSTAINVQLQEETVWLTQKQMSLLFDKNIMTVNEHIRNVYKEAELNEKSTIRKSLTVQREGKREVTREITFYNLDVIISVGYRVKSKRGTQFRIWASKILKDYLVKGYSVNEKRLKETNAKLSELKSAVKLLGTVIRNKEITSDEAKGLISVISDYTLVEIPSNVTTRFRGKLTT